MERSLIYRREEVKERFIEPFFVTRGTLCMILTDGVWGECKVEQQGLGIKEIEWGDCLDEGSPLDYLDKESLPSSNDLSKLVSFSMFVRMLIDGFEEEILVLIRRMELKKEGQSLFLKN